MEERNTTKKQKKKSRLGLILLKTNNEMSSTSQAVQQLFCFEGNCFVLQRGLLSHSVTGSLFFSI